MSLDPEAVVARVLRFVDARGVLQPGPVVLAVSGGQDSVCMLDLLARLRSPLSIDLHVAHLNHMFRGRQSAAEAAYVEKLARQRALSATVASIDVPAFRARHRLSKQVAARYARLQFLAAVAGSVSARQIAVGHTADDAVETFLLNLLRGSGLAGLRGMAPTRRLQAGQLGPRLEEGDWRTEQLAPTEGELPILARPILELFRVETEGYCLARGLSFRRDPSNLDLAYRRSWIRAELLPFLERHAPNVKERLRNTGDLLAEDHTLVSGMVERSWNETARLSRDRIEFDLAKWQTLDAALRRHLLRRAVETLAGSLEGLGRTHVDAAEAAVSRGSVGARVDLPLGLRLEKGYSSFWLTLAPASLPEDAAAPAVPASLTVPGSVSLAGGVLDAAVMEVEGGDWSEYCSGSRWEACLDAEKVGTTLSVRRRRPGDRFVPLGMTQEKKLHDFLVDEKVPRGERDRVPLVATPNDIVWVVGYRIDDRFKVTLGTRRVLRLRYGPGVSAGC